VIFSVARQDARAWPDRSMTSGDDSAGPRAGPALPPGNRPGSQGRKLPRADLSSRALDGRAAQGLAREGWARKIGSMAPGTSVKLSILRKTCEDKTLAVDARRGGRTSARQVPAPRRAGRACEAMAAGLA